MLPPGTGCIKLLQKVPVAVPACWLSTFPKAAKHMQEQAAPLAWQGQGAVWCAWVLAVQQYLHAIFLPKSLHLQRRSMGESIPDRLAEALRERAAWNAEYPTATIFTKSMTRMDSPAQCHQSSVTGVRERT